MLTDEEILILRDTGFGSAVGEFIRSQTEKRIERALGKATALDEDADADGLSIAVRDGEEAENLIKQLQPGLSRNGCRAFWSVRHRPNGLRQTDEVVILKTTDDTAIVRFRHTDGANYDITTENILHALKSWRDIADFEVAGADHDFVMLVFRRLPERICDFASTVYELCPDSASQGPGIDPKWNNPEKIALATQLCPSVTAKSRDMPEEVLSMMGEDFQELLIADMQKDVRLLALKLRETRELFLWWD